MKYYCFVIIFILVLFIVRKRVVWMVIWLRLIESRNLMTTYSTFMKFSFNSSSLRSKKKNDFTVIWNENQDNNVLWNGHKKHHRQHLITHSNGIAFNVIRSTVKIWANPNWSLCPHAPDVLSHNRLQSCHLR